MKRRYVTAFPGRRDSYQVPMALHEHGRLEQFVTDSYAAGPVARVLRACGARGLDRRQCSGLPEPLVRPGFDLEIGSRLLARVMAPSRGAVIADDWLARRGAAAANAGGSSVVFYEFQAELGFRLLRSARQRRILFHFHPHPDWEHPLLQADVRRHPEFAALVRAHTRAGLAPRYADHTRRAWCSADQVIVASTCTKESLQHAGCPAERIAVVPYGRETVEVSDAPVTTPPPERPYLLWVGAGSHRKGLHHLCRAWELSGAAKHADLVVVARVVDPGMEPLLARPGITWIQGLPRAELTWRYRHARAFVLPSMSEGFGQVYLEALTHGCPVVGTRHSVLPDATAAQPWITYVTPGAEEELAAAIDRTLRRPAVTPEERAAITAAVTEFTWERFRTGLETVLARFD